MNATTPGCPWKHFRQSVFAAAQALYIDFNGSGDPLTPADDNIATECILGLRVAARNLFRCDLSQLRRHLPVQHEHLFTLTEVMRFLASQKRNSLGLGTDAIMLQVITVDELQLVVGQSEVLQNNSRKLVDLLIGNLAAWMISGNGHVNMKFFKMLCRLNFCFTSVFSLTLCSFAWKLAS